MSNFIDGRKEAAKISNGHAEPNFIGERSREAALQKIKSHQENYDQGAVNSLHGLELNKYLKELQVVNAEAAKHKLPLVQNLAAYTLTKEYYKLIRRNPRYRNQNWIQKMEWLEETLRLVPSEMKRHIIEQAMRAVTRGSFD